MQVTLNALPASLAEFQNLPRNTPEEVVAGFLCALHLYTKNPNEGVEAMNLLRGPRPMTPYDGQFLRDRLRGKEYLTTAYFAGARFFELKTVQIMDGEAFAACIARPCILADDEGYNCEWSTELTVAQAADEYVKAWHAEVLFMTARESRRRKT